MSEVKHTPGPWAHYAGKLRPQFSTFIHEVQDANGIAIVKWGGFDGVEQPKRVVAANARLIAAAPDLLIVAQCEEALDGEAEAGYAVLEQHGWDRSMRFELPATEFVRRLRRAALSKATGSQA